MRSLVRLGLALLLALASLTAAPLASALPDAGKATPAAKEKGTKDKGTKDKGAKDKAHAKDKSAKDQAHAGKDKDAGKKSPRDAPRKRPKGPLSEGAPNAGHLYGGQHLASSKSLEVKKGAHTWGLPPLVRALRHAAVTVSRKHKGSVLLVGDLSAKSGGPLVGHNSHQSGRDADVGFYMRSDAGRHANPHRFVAFGSDGRPRDGSTVHFDDERNWLLVQTLLEDEKANVRYLFVSNGLRGRLLAHASKKQVPKELYTKAAATLMSPKDVDVHDDHFHVRIGCPESMRAACVEESNVRFTGIVTATSKGDAPDAGSAKEDGAGKAEAAPAAGAQDKAEPTAQAKVPAAKP